MAPRVKPTLAAVALAAIGLAAGNAVRTSFEGAATTAGAWPRTGELDSLSGYLQAVEDSQTPRIEIARTRLEGGTVPALDGPPVWDELGPLEAPVEARQPRAPAPERPVRRLSAILITGSQRVAIVDDREVRPGDRLPGGAEVVGIDADQVVVRERDGARTVLRL